MLPYLIAALQDVLHYEGPESRPLEGGHPVRDVLSAHIHRDRLVLGEVNPGRDVGGEEILVRGNRWDVDLLHLSRSKTSV